MRGIQRPAMYITVFTSPDQNVKTSEIIPENFFLASSSLYTDAASRLQPVPTNVNAISETDRPLTVSELSCSTGGSCPATWHRYWPSSLALTPYRTRLNVPVSSSPSTDSWRCGRRTWRFIAIMSSPWFQKITSTAVSICARDRHVILILSTVLVVAIVSSDRCHNL